MITIRNVTRIAMAKRDVRSVAELVELLNRAGHTFKYDAVSRFVNDTSPVRVNLAIVCGIMDVLDVPLENVLRVLYRNENGRFTETLDNDADSW